jgi:APA family basic amino acid/polyamine antiporter
MLTDLSDAIGFSSFGVLIYYLIANVSAYTQSSDRRRYPRILQIVGMAGCSTLVLTLPLKAVLGGGVVFAAGIVYRAIRMRFDRTSMQPLE